MNVNLVNWWVARSEVMLSMKTVRPVSLRVKRFLEYSIEALNASVNLYEPATLHIESV